MPTRIILVLMLGMLIFSACAQDALSPDDPGRETAKEREGGYAYSLIGTQKQVEGTGRNFEMAVATQTPNMSTCQEVHQNKIEVLKAGSFWDNIEGECDDTAESDSFYASVFNNKPASKLYLSFKDLDGFETRVNFMGATLPAARALADMVIPEYLNLGIQDIRIIEPNP